MTYRALAVAFALALLVPAFPPATAAVAEPCPPSACTLIPLYVGVPTAGTSVRTLSALPGDAMVTDSRTYASGSFSASTPPLAFDLTLLREDAFFVNLTSKTDARYVEGSVTVRAVAPDGQTFTLAHHEFLAPPHPDSAMGLVGYHVDPANDTGIDLPGSTLPRALVENAADAVSTIADGLQGGPAQPLAAEAHRRTCIPSDTFFCRQLTGRFGTNGAFDVCAPSPGQNSLLAQVLWTGVNSADTAQASLSGQRACGTNTIDTLNASASEADEAFGNATNGLRDALPPLVDDEPTPPPHDWRSFSLDVNLTSLPGSATTIRIPSGLRITYDVWLSEVIYGPASRTMRTPILFELGRADTATSLAVRTSTPQAFSRLVLGAELIGPGNHTGFLSTPSDVDDYAFDLPEGASFDLTRVEYNSASPYSYAVFDPDGRFVGSNYAAASGPAGRWTVRVGDGPGMSPTEYAFHLQIRTGPKETDGGRIEEGVHTGTLGVGDDSDPYEFYADHGQGFVLRLESTADLAARLEPTSPLLQREDTTAPGIHEIRGRAASTGLVTFDVKRNYGAGGYTLTLDLNDDENHSVVPVLASAWIAEGAHVFRPSLSGYAGGVEFVHDGKILRVTPSSNETVKVGVTGGDIQRRADGALVHVNGAPGAIVVDTPEELTPIAAVSVPFAFGPEHIHYVRGGELVTISADRTRSSLPAPASGTLIVDPAGRIHLLTGELTYVLEGNEFVYAPHLEGVLAFDAENRAYRVLDRTLVERLDLDGSRHIVARAPTRIADLAFSGEILYAALDGAGASANRGIAFVDLGTPGFEGHHPPFPITRAPDLVPAGLTQVAGGVSVQPHGPLLLPGQDQTLVVSVHNAGAGPAKKFHVSVRLDCSSCSSALTEYHAEQNVSGLAAGETIALEFPWHSGYHVGDVEFDVWILPHLNEVPETNETNNRAEYSGTVLVGGQEGACRATVGDLRMPFGLFGVDRMEELCRLVRV